MSIERIILIYNADGGVFGELRYFVGKAIGITKCELCSVTHRGLSVKEEWRQASTSFELPIEGLHLNELSAELRTFAGGEYPSVVAQSANGFSWVLRPKAITALEGHPHRLAEAIRSFIRSPL